MWYNKRMDTLSRMTLTLAIATFLLAIAAFGTMWQTRNIRKAERRERLLNEIIDWAIDITRVNFGGEITVTPGISQQTQGRQDNVNRLLNCQLLAVKGEELLEPMALSVSKELSGAIKQVLNNINVILGILRTGVPYSYSKEANDKVKANDTILEKNLRALLNKTAEYKK